MLLAPKYYELDLPVIDEDTHVFNVHDGEFDPDKYFSETGNTSFIRNITVGSYRRHGSLKDVLKKAEDEFEVIAELCGALAVGPHWALKIDSASSNWNLGNAKNIIPKNHIIVAEVDLICNLKKRNDMPSPFLKNIRNGIKEYRGALREEIDIWQFGVGINKNRKEQSEAAWLLDVEVMLR